MNRARITRAIRKSYVTARAAVAEARECRRFGDRIGFRAALETIQMCRRLNAERRAALS